jgi:hypothetical protein
MSLDESPFASRKATLRASVDDCTLGSRRKVTADWMAALSLLLLLVLLDMLASFACS